MKIYFNYCRSRIIFISVIYLLMLSGCSSMFVKSTETESSVTQYKQLYFLEAEEDPRNIVPVVAERLQGMGFNVKRVNQDEPIEGAQGSGFIISPDGQVLTSNHVLKNKKEATLWIKDSRIEVDVICNDKEIDLALLKPKLMQMNVPEPLPLDFDTEVKMGQDVYNIGFPLSNILGKSPRLNKGLVSSTVGIKDNPDFLQVSVESQAGNSGGPLLDENGAVIGVMQGTLNPLNVMLRTGGTLPQNVNFAVKLKAMKRFLDKCGVNVQQSPANLDNQSFDKSKDSVAQVYSGIVTKEFLEQPKLVCILYYQSFWDLWFRFRVFYMAFYDYDTGDLLYEVGQTRDDPFSSQGTVINKIMKEIETKFFPESS